MVTGAPRETDLLREETFGPVAPIVPVASLDEAIELANASPYGLGANVYTRDLETAIRCARELRAGTVWINDPLTDNDAGPFGGMKRSGLGRELGQEGLDAFQETKHVHIETKLEVKDWWYPTADHIRRVRDVVGACTRPFTPARSATSCCRADDDGRLTGLYLRHDGRRGGDGPFDAAREQLDAYFAGELEDVRPAARPARHARSSCACGTSSRASPSPRRSPTRSSRCRLGDLKLVRAVGLANGRNPGVHRHSLSPRHRSRRDPGGVRRRARSQALAARPRGRGLGAAAGRRLTYQVESNVPGR